MTPDTPTEKRETDDSTATMGGVDHTHPERNTTFGSVFGRGPSVAADGGEPATGGRSSSDRRSDGGEPAATPEAADNAAMEDVDHDAPSETGPNATFERGAEHAAESEPTDVTDPTDVDDPVDEAPTDE